MGLYIGYRDGGKTDEKGLHKELSRLYTAGISLTYDANSFKVTQRAAGANMSVDVAIGDVHLFKPDNTYSFWGFSDTVTNVTISAADPTNPRIDAIVAYIDMTVVSSASPNNPGALKIVAVAGTPAGSPSALSDSTIQSTIGSANGFQRLANVTVNAATSSITNGVITDARTPITPFIVDGQITSADLASNAVTNSKIAAASVSNDKLYSLHSAEAYIANNTIVILGGWNRLSTNASRNVNGIVYPGIASRTDTLKIVRAGWYNIGGLARVGDGGSGNFLFRAIALDAAGNVLRGLAGSDQESGALGGLVTLSAMVYMNADEVITYQVFNTSDWRPSGNADSTGASQLPTDEDRSFATRFWAVEVR